MTRSSFFKTLAGLIVGAPVVAKALGQPATPTPQHLPDQMSDGFCSVIYYKPPGPIARHGATWFNTDNGRWYECRNGAWVGLGQKSSP